MSAAMRLRILRAAFALLRVTGGTLVSACIVSCEDLFDADDALCHAVAAAKNGPVDWPEDAHWYSCRSSEYFGQEGAFVKRRFMVLA